MNYIYVMIIFLVFGLAILFAAHFLFYFSIIRFFGIEGILFRKILAWILAILAVSFFFSMFLVQWKDFFLTRAIYFLSGLWLGFLFYLLLALAAVWLIFWAGRIFDFDASRAVLGVVFFSAAFLFSVYGVWNAFNPKLRDISVVIPDLPAVWQGRKIVQISDTHFGAIFRDSFAENLVEKVNSIHPDAVFITGDLLDIEDGDFGSLADILNKIEAPRGIFFITGNHETYIGVGQADEILSKTKVKILKDEVVDLEGLKIIGINYPERNQKKDIVETVKKFQKDFNGKPNILLYHSPVYIKQFAEMGINLQLAGHVHKGQIFPIEFISKLIYGRYIYGLHKLGNHTVYTTAGAGSWGPTLRTSGVPEIPVITLQQSCPLI
ncbi:MAG: metallophosphoesterase [Candidatus Portnoybacteria bacterium]|nr:metallophosphoesterase [Candidatus Portnoybacteria bacterium]